MIQNLTISNFKALKHVEMKELANVNILLGKNNSGKTSVLEALFLLSLPSNVQSVLDLLNKFRGYETGANSGEILDSVFYNWERSQAIYMESNENDKINSRSMSIRPIIGGEFNVSSKDIGVVESSEMVKVTTGLSFLFRINGKKFHKIVNNLRDGAEPSTSEQMKQDLSVAFVPARGIFESNKEAIRFSQLERSNRNYEINEIIDLLRILEPNLNRLFVGATEKGNAIYADVGGNRPMPLTLMGDGTLHSFSIALTMVNNQNGLVLIDEIENGLHYSVLTDVWKMIFQTSKKLNVQVFATMHSDECLKAAYEAVESLKCDDCLKLYRFDRIKDGTRVEDYTAEELFYAITSNQEVR